MLSGHASPADNRPQNPQSPLFTACKSCFAEPLPTHSRPRNPAPRTRYDIHSLPARFASFRANSRNLRNLVIIIGIRSSCPDDPGRYRKQQSDTGAPPPSMLISVADPVVETALRLDTDRPVRSAMINWSGNAAGTASDSGSMARWIQSAVSFNR